MRRGRAGPLVFLIAGESSGDLIASRLMAALARCTGGAVRFAGVGGPLMAERGLESLFPYSELSLMGFLEVASRASRLLRRIRTAARAARRARPAVLVTVDAPEFNLRVARRLAGTGFPLIHYVAPTVWAYRAGRAARMARYLDHVLCLYPFEPPCFEAVGLGSSFVGHPLVEEPIAAADGPGFRARHGISPGRTVLCALPGSRVGELRRHLPVFGATIQALAGRFPDLRVFVPTPPQHGAAVRAVAGSWAVPATVVEGTAEKYAAFAASDAALAASGTATLELALAGVPMVVCYRADRLTAAIARRVLRVPHIAMPNIIAGHRAAPEFVQRDCTAERLAPALERLLRDDAFRRDQMRSFRQVASRLGRGGPPPSTRAAAAVLRLIDAPPHP